MSFLFSEKTLDTINIKELNFVDANILQIILTCNTFKIYFEKILNDENAVGKDRRNKLLTFIESADAEIINPELAIGYNENTFLNINTQKDYNNLLTLINK